MDGNCVVSWSRGCSKLAILDLNEEQASAAGIALVQQIEAAGTAAKGEIETVGYGLDVSNEQSVVNTIKSIVDKWGRIDSLVTAAGLCPGKIPAPSHLLVP